MPEKRMANAFEAALVFDAILVINEVDSLLFDRTQTVRSWEVTQVNVMLTWITRLLYKKSYGSFG